MTGCIKSNGSPRNACRQSMHWSHCYKCNKVVGSSLLITMVSDEHWETCWRSVERPACSFLLVKLTSAWNRDVINSTLPIQKNSSNYSRVPLGMPSHPVVASSTCG